MTQYVKVPNYAVEARIKEAAAAAGMKQEAIDSDLIEQVRAGHVNEQNIADKLTEWQTYRGASGERHHYFGGSGKASKDEADAAFGPDRTLKAQLDFARKHGEAAAIETAAQYGVSLGTGFKKSNGGNGADHANNPFARLRKADGTIDPAVAAEVAAMTAALGTKKTEAIAKAVGKTITGLPLRCH